MSAKTEATIEDLYHVPENGKAEIVNREVVLMSPTGQKPSRASFKICLRLYEYERQSGRGIAVADNAAFKVDLPNRKSFSPDAAFYVGQHPGMKFFDSAPLFAVEVRSENDYGPKAERKIKEKILDYFAAGTKVVWDVDLLGEDVIRAYQADSPDEPRVYHRGETADAEFALPGWTMTVNDLFE